MTNVPVDIKDIDCHLAVGHEWIDLILDNPSFPDTEHDLGNYAVPSHIKKSLFIDSDGPFTGEFLLLLQLVVKLYWVQCPHCSALVWSLANVVCLDEPVSCLWIIFPLDIDVLHQCCAMHGIVVTDLES